LANQRHIALQWAGITFLLGLVITSIGSWWLHQHNQDLLYAHLDQGSRKVVDDIYTRIGLYQYGLKAVAGAVLSSDDHEISRTNFNYFSKTQSLVTEFPGAVSFGYVQRVPEGDEVAFMESMRQLGNVDMDAEQLKARAGDHLIVTLAEPTTSAHILLGEDLSRMEITRSALLAALSVGNARVSSPIKIPGFEFDTLLYMFFPVFDGGETPTAELDRQELLLGWSYVLFSLPDALTDLGIDSRYVRLHLSEVDGDNLQPLYHSATLSNETVQTKAMVRTVYGKRWLFELQALPDISVELNMIQPQWALIAGALISLILAALADKWVEVRMQRGSVAVARSRLRSFVETTPDAVISTDLMGRITQWNAGAETLFGFSQEEALGKWLSDLVVPDAARHEEEDILVRVRKGETLANLRSRRVTKNHITIHIMQSVSPLFNDGRVVGSARVLRNIGDEIMAQQQLEAMNRSLENLAETRNQELDTSRRFMRNLIDAMPPAVAYISNDMRLTLVNAAFCRNIGKTEEELVGQKVFDHTHPALRDRLEEYFFKAMAGEVQYIENNFTGQDGDISYIVSQMIPDQDGDAVKGIYVVTYDVTELAESQKRLTQAMRENEALLHTINERLLFAKISASGKLLHVNDNVTRVLGYSRELLLGQSPDLKSLFASEQKLWDEIIASLISGKPWQGEMFTHHKNGKLVVLQCVAVPEFDDHDRVVGMYCLAMDVSASKAIEVERDRLNMLYESLLTTDSDIAVIATDNLGNITLFNHGAEILLGYTVEKVVGKRKLPSLASCRLIEDKNDLKQVPLCDIVHHVEAGGSSQFFCQPDEGPEFIASMSVSHLHDADGTQSGWVIFLKNITDEVEGQQILVETRDQLSIASEVAGLGVWTWDLATGDFVWNKRMYEIFETSESELPVPTVDYLLTRMHPEDVAPLRANLERAIAGDGNYELDFRIRDNSDNFRFLQSKAQVERFQSGLPRRAIGIVVDITEQLRQEQELRKAKKLSDASNQAKSQFLANMSHEIRTPLNAVLGMLQLLQQSDLDNLQADYTANATVAAKSLLSLLNGILDFSKIEAGKLELDLHSFAPENLFSDLGVVLCGNHRHSGVDIIFDVSTQLPRKILGDAMRLSQVLLNLSGNALKFTAKGHVVVAAKAIAGLDNSVTIRFEVIDTGIGISEKQREKIFSGFVQAETSTTRKYGGTGLGLAISKRLVELMGGELMLASEVGQGTRFWFDLNFPVLDPQAMVGGIDDLLDRRLILLEPNVTLAKMLAAQLGSLKLKVTPICTPEELPRQSKAADFILLTNGYITDPEVTAFLENQKLAPIVLHLERGQTLTPPAVELAQPYLPQQLLQALRSADNADTVTKRVSLQKPGQRLQGLSLLVVEDNAVNREIANKLLLREGARVDLATGGIDGVAMVTAANKTYDAVIMDIQMPDIDGLEATRRIRADERFQYLPILALTANASNADRDACLAAGMDGHLTKPIVLNQVVASLLALVNNRPLIPENNDAEVTNTAMDYTKAPLVDEYEELLSRFGNNLVLLQMVYKKFLPEIDHQVAELLVNVDNADIKATQVSLHTMKGVSATVGARRLAEYLNALEAQFRVDRAPLPATILHSECRKELQHLISLSNESLRTLIEVTAKESAQRSSVE